MIKLSKGIVAIVGAPNVGKSTIFNRIVGERHAIVHDEAGVTRDRLYGNASWLTREFRVIDTGGVEIKEAPFQEQIRAQAEIAIEEADVIIFVVDGNIGVTNDDRFVAKILHKSEKPVILAANKIDNIEKATNAHEFFALGIGEPIAVSGSHGIGIGDVLDEIIKQLPDQKNKVYENAIAFSIIGRPNVGKSSLTNALLGQDRVIVSNIEGTTRDAIDTAFVRDEQEYVVIDTAGLKKRGKIYESVDKYAAIRALAAIDRSDVVLLVIDAEDGIKQQDKHVAGYAMEANKAIIIIVNKWDAVDKDEKTMPEFTKKIRTEFKFLDYAPIVFISAKNKTRIKNIFPEIISANHAYNYRVLTSTLNQIMQDAQIINPPPYFEGGRLKIYFANQVAIKPPTFVLFVNEPTYLHFSYQRYLENRLRGAFEFSGTPIKIIARARRD